MISDSIGKEIAKALKDKNKIRLSTLRMLSSSLNYERIALQRDLKKEDEIKVVRREVKKRTDAIDFLHQASAKGGQAEYENKINQRVKQEEEELEILNEYLPKEMSDEDLQSLVEKVIKTAGANDIKDMGRVIGEVMKKAEGRVEGGKVANLVKARLSKVISG